MTDNVTQRLLIIDDDKRIRDGLAAFLEKHDFMVSLARNRAEAKQHLASHLFDLAILDVMLQQESGFECLVDDLVPRQIPTIILSAKGESEDRITGLEKGAADYITKPFVPRELILRIRNIIDKR